MTKKGKHQGLCMTCKNDPTCKLPRALSLPIEQCEEFVSRVARQAATCQKRRGRNSEVPETMEQEPAATALRDKAAMPAVEAAREMGLCSNCEIRETCNLPDARKGVQHCEEYQ